MNKIFRKVNRYDNQIRGTLRRRRAENRSEFKLKRRERTLAQFTMEKLEYDGHPWFTLARVKALAGHYQKNLNFSWRRNKIEHEERAVFVEDQRKMEKELYRANLMRKIEFEKRENAIIKFYEEDYETIPFFFKKQFEDLMEREAQVDENFNLGNMYYDQMRRVMKEREANRRSFLNRVETIERDRLGTND